MLHHCMSLSRFRDRIPLANPIYHAYIVVIDNEGEKPMKKHLYTQDRQGNVLSLPVRDDSTAMHQFRILARHVPEQFIEVRLLNEDGSKVLAHAHEDFE